MSKIPKNPAWCSDCITGSTPCEYHWSDGEARAYEGIDTYEPSLYALEVVGGRYRHFEDEVYECFGYDPRSGFWMLAVVGPKVGRKTSISEAAIGRTFYRVCMTSGARIVLLMHVVLGRAPTAAEMAENGAHPEYASRTLRDLGLVDANGITKAGREEAAKEWP